MERAEIAADRAGIGITDVTVHDERDTVRKKPRRELLGRPAEAEEIAGIKLQPFFRGQTFSAEAFLKNVIVNIHLKSGGDRHLFQNPPQSPFTKGGEKGDLFFK